MTEYKIYAGSLTNPKAPTTSDIELSCEVDVDAFLASDQSEYPTMIAHALNSAIAFADAVVEDIPDVTELELAVAPGLSEDGYDCIPYVRILKATSASEAGLSVSDSLLFFAYAAVAEVDPGVMDFFAVTASVNNCSQYRYKVTVNVNNDKSGEIKDITQAIMLISYDTDKPRWSLNLLGTYDITSDKYVAVDGVTEVDDA